MFSITTSGILFNEEVYFCCDDLDNEDLRVQMRVYDIDPGSKSVADIRHNEGGNLYGRYTECMVRVEVRDKLPHRVIGLPDVTVSCEITYDKLNVFGRLRMSYNSSKAVSYEEGDLLFTIQVTHGGEDFDLADIELENMILNAEYYDSNFNTRNIELQVEEKVDIQEGSFVMLQNSPNPFIDETTIKIHNNGEQRIGQLKFYDIDGRLIHSIERNFEQGETNIIVNRDLFPGQSVIIYQLQIGDEIESRKMIRIE